MTYGELKELAAENDIEVKELPLVSSDGRIRGRKIAIRHDIETNAEKACVLAEELGHYYTSIGNILDTSTQVASKQELRARRFAHNLLIDYDQLYKAKLSGCTSSYEIAEYLGVAESFLNEALENLKMIYGLSFCAGKYRIDLLDTFDITLLDSTE
ncbi:MAG: ImmA/IrrE family metallo-endopeptidase [Eubacteriales bacterium]|nr:ImmA/IrrE family metallo-endopeptidase [Eubacteriales bacterium]